MRRAIIILLFPFFCIQTYSQEETQLNLLTHLLDTYTDQDLLEDNFTPLPAASQREYWNSFEEPVKADIIRKAEEKLTFQWLATPLSSYLEYTRSGNRKVNEIYYDSKKNALKDLILGEIIEGKGRFIDAILDGVWSFCEQSFWGISAHTNLQRAGIGVPDIMEPTIDLTVGETANILSWAYYLFADQFEQISPLINQRIEYEIEKRVIQPYLKRDDFWWQGWTKGRVVNNWNPWCNYNVLTATLLISKDKAQKIAVIKKTMRSVDQFINYYKPDGACEEGPAYWDHAAGKMLEYLQLLQKASGGKINIFDHPLIRNMGLYIARAYIGNGYYLNFADASANCKVIPDIVYRYGQAIEDESLLSLGAFLAQQKTNHPGSCDQELYKLPLIKEMMERKTPVSYPDFFHFKDTQIIGARSHDQSIKGYFFGAKGGFNEESHNHNDVGTFILYYNADPILIDAGVGTYTMQTFSKDRYKIWSMTSAYHNLPLVNSVEQTNGKPYKATSVKAQNSAQKTIYGLNIEQAYPGEARLDQWRREYVFDRKKGLFISDHFSLQEVRQPNEIHFMVANGTENLSKGKIILKGKKENLILSFDPERFDSQTEPILLTDPRLSNVWGEKIYRLKLKDKSPSLKGKYQFHIYHSNL